MIGVCTAPLKPAGCLLQVSAAGGVLIFSLSTSTAAHSRICSSEYVVLKRQEDGSGPGARAKHVAPEAGKLGWKDIIPGMSIGSCLAMIHKFL